MALTKVIGSGIGTVTNQFVDANMSAGSVIQAVTATRNSSQAESSNSFVTSDNYLLTAQAAFICFAFSTYFL